MIMIVIELRKASRKERKETQRGARRARLGKILWNPVGVRYLLPIPTQRALRDTGLWSLTPSALILGTQVNWSLTLSALEPGFPY